jgi:hypothetical protein
MDNFSLGVTGHDVAMGTSLENVQAQNWSNFQQATFSSSASALGKVMRLVLIEMGEYSFGARLFLDASEMDQKQQSLPQDAC